MARLALVCVALAAVTAVAATPAAAQTTTPEDTFTDSFKETLVFNPATVTTTTVTNYSTQILGRLNGGTPLYDQTFGVPFADPAAQAGVAAARAAITTAGGPGVIVGAPVLTASSSTTASTSSTLYSVAGLPVAGTPVTIVTFGPAPIQIGVLSSCSIGSLPSATRPTCMTPGGTTYNVGDDETNFNTTHTTIYTINESTTTTNTTALFEQYTLFGTVQAFGLAHTAVQSGALDAGSRFLRRMGDEAGSTDAASSAFAMMPAPGVIASSASRFRVWAEGYGVWSKSRAAGAVPGDDRVQYGFAAGLAGSVTPNFSLGIGIDHGNTGITLDSGFERGDISLTQIGLYAGATAGPWFASLAGTVGFGEAKTRHDLGGLTSARYDLTTAGVLGEAGHRLQWGLWRVTPSLGFDYTAVQTAGFAEFGPLALVAPAHRTDRTRVWAGLDLGQRFGLVDWSIYGRLVGIVAGEERLLPVAFFAVPMTITGVPEAKLGGDAGARLSYTIAPSAEIFARYDGRFRDGFTAHAATGGMKVNF